MVQQLKQLRVEIDGYVQLMDKVTHHSNHLRHAVDKCEMAKAWLGKLLGYLGEETPYKNDGKRKTVEDIEPTDSKNNEAVFGDVEGQTPFRDKTQIEKIDWLRQSVSEVITKVEKIDHDTKLTTREQSICRTNAWTLLTEVRMELGFELGVIRKQSGK